MESIFQESQNSLGFNFNEDVSDLVNDYSADAMMALFNRESQLWDEYDLSLDTLDMVDMHLPTPGEDCKKILEQWNEQMGAMQASDSEDLDVCPSEPFLEDMLFDGDVSLLSVPPCNSRSLLKPRQERLSASNVVYGLKAESQDVQLPIMSDSEDEIEVLKPIKQIKMELEDEDCVDVETVVDHAPIIEAPDLKTLMEQFEASTKVNQAADMVNIVPSSLPTVSNNLLVLSKQKIRDALPQEMVEKIKASSRKVIHVIPAIPSKPLVTGTRMQDAAATLNRNKLLKIVAAGDSVQRDHDYCSSIGETPPPQINFQHSNSVEYKPSPVPSRTSSETAKENKELKPAATWDNNSKKDSGLESGEVSDASEEAAPLLNVAAEAPSLPPVKVKKKINLQEYRSRREELDRQKASGSSSNVSNASSCLSSPTHPASPEQVAVKPEMHSVEVQTQDHDISTQQLAKTENKDFSKVERPSRSTHKNRQYRSHNSEFHGRSTSRSSCSSSTCSSYRRSGQKSRRKQRRSSSLSSSGSSNSRSRSTGASSAKRRRHDSPSYRRASRQVSRYSNSSRSRNRSNSQASTTSSHTSNTSSEWYLNGKDRQRQVEERRVIYVGRLPDGTTKMEVRKRFEVFGPIIDISIHFREHGDNYGFVTFAYKNHAYDAVEHGNDDPELAKYDLCFGGRRSFCKVRYSDLDAQNIRNKGGNLHHEDTFDNLLRETQAKLQKRGKLL